MSQRASVGLERIRLEQFINFRDGPGRIYLRQERLEFRFPFITLEVILGVSLHRGGRSTPNLVQRNLPHGFEFMLNAGLGWSEGQQKG